MLLESFATRTLVAEKDGLLHTLDAAGNVAVDDVVVAMDVSKGSCCESGRVLGGLVASVYTRWVWVGRRKRSWTFVCPDLMKRMERTATMMINGIFMIDLCIAATDRL